MLFKLIKLSNKQEFLHEVVSLSSIGETGERIASLGISVKCLEMKRPWHLATGAFQLARHIKRFAPDVVQTWLYHADLLGLIAGKWASAPNVVWNVRCSDMSTAYTTGTRRLLVSTLRRLSHIPTAIITNSKAGKEWHSTLGYDPKRWVIIPNGFDIASFRPNTAARSKIRAELGLSRDALLVGLIARYDPIKGHSIFMEAASKLSSEQPDVHYLIAGEGCDQHNTELAGIRSGAPLPNNFHFLGLRSDIEDVTAALDVATCTSIGEGFPNAVGEAMACGIPCIATDVGDNQEICANDELIVPAGNVDALHARLSKVLSMEEEARRALGLSGRQRIADTYELADIVDRYQHFFDEIACGTTRGAS